MEHILSQYMDFAGTTTTHGQGAPQTANKQGQLSARLLSSAMMETIEAIVTQVQSQRTRGPALRANVEVHFAGL